ncbi:MAG: hypothetical protein ACFBSG_07925 [Leptolyngbyaceae cyanobacterium]
MNQSLFLSTLVGLIGIGAVLGSAPSSQALCVDDGTLSLERDTAPNDNSFVNSSPASSESSFKLELDLDQDLDIFSNDSEEMEETVDAATTDADTTAAAAADTDADTAPTVADLEEGNGSAADLDTLEAGGQPSISREEYLEARASEINNCP